MNWLQTLRGKLTLWNLGVLAVTLTLFGLLLNVANQRRLAAEIDRQLLDRAHNFRPGPPPGGGPGQPGREGPPEDRIDLRRPQIFDVTGAMLDFGGRGGQPPYDPSLIPEALKGNEVWANGTYLDRPVRILAAPVFRGPARGGVVEVAQDMTQYRLLVQQQLVTLLIVLPMAIVVAGLGAMFLTDRALKPIALVTATAGQIGENNLSERLQVQGKDELAELSRTFNEMIDRLQASFVSLHAAYDEQRRFTADASHELRTPLTRLRLATSAGLAQEGDTAALLESLKVADQAAESMGKIVHQLLLLSQSDAGTFRIQPQRLDLRVVAAEAIDTSLAAARVQVSLGDRPIWVDADPEYLRRAIANLLDNAAKHGSVEGRPGIELSIASAGSEVALSVADHGKGIAPENLARLGERFFRVDAARGEEGGYGLGLSICKSIVAAHHGRLQFESAVGQGTTATIFLPAPQNS